MVFYRISEAKLGACLASLNVYLNNKLQRFASLTRALITAGSQSISAELAAVPATVPRRFTTTGHTVVLITDKSIDFAAAVGQFNNARTLLAIF